MSYLDGYVIAVKTAEKDQYVKLAEEAAEVFLDHGALQVMESWGNDVPDGELTSLPMAVQCEADETVVFSWVLWPSKEARDKGIETSMQDDRFKDYEKKSLPFDGKRMIFGGFDVIVDQSK